MQKGILGLLGAVVVIVLSVFFNHTQHQTTTNSSANQQSAQQNTNEDTVSNTADGKQIPVTLVSAVDGDTIKIMYNGKKETVRYLLVDTPESKKVGTCVQPYAKEAYYRNEQLVKSGKLTIEFDNGSKRDKYGRLLAYVFVNGKSVQESLLEEGYARVAYIYDPPYKYLSQFNADEKKAEDKHLKIWSRPGYVTSKGFNGCASDSGSSASDNQSNSNTTQSSSAKQQNQTGSNEYFRNCTELRKKYPNGVPSSSPAYQASMDGDHDHYACERSSR